MAMFRSGRALFKPHELVVLDAIRAGLPVEAQALLDAQLDAVTMIQRHQDEREVNLYAGRRGARSWPDACAFPNRTEELKLATVRLAGSTTGKAVATSVRGHVFQLWFSPAPQTLGNEIRVTGLTLHADPLEVVQGRTGDLARRVPGRFLAELEGLWASGNATALMGRDEIHAFHLDDGEYLMLAQLPNTDFVALPLDPPGDRVLQFDTSGSVTGSHASVAAALGA